MAHAPRSALVLQGGGALGAYELGAARRLYADAHFAPDIVAGVSIGAITAALLARPAKGLKPIEALERFWREVTVQGRFLPPTFRPYASVFGNPNFYVPRIDYFTLATWTNFYDTAPLRQTLARLVDLDALSDPDASPALLFSATDVEKGQIEYFYSRDHRLTVDHIIASESLPPSFPMTVVGGNSYWDGGLFDNTPLGAVLERMDRSADADRTIFVVNLFPNEAPIPHNMVEVAARAQNLQFANKTAEDVKLLYRINEVADLMRALENLPEGNPLKDDPAYQAVAARGYVCVPNIVSITRPDVIGGFDSGDFSPETISARAEEGYAQTDKALAARA